MPDATYMVVDRRHDHGFRVPRPDLSARFGVTNACNDCHADRPAAWAAEAVERWFGPRREGVQTWTEAFDAAWREQPRAGELLLPLASSRTAPGIAQASALEALAPYMTRERLEAVTPALADPDPLVRVGALRSLRSLPPEARWRPSGSGSISGWRWSGSPTPRSSTSATSSKGIRQVSPNLALAVFGGAAPANLGIALDVRGPILSTANSCASGAVALGEALGTCARVGSTPRSRAAARSR